MENNANLKDLYQRYLDNNCTESELETLFNYFGTADEHHLQQLISFAMAQMESEQANASEQQTIDKIHGQLTTKLFGGYKEKQVSVIRLWPRIAAAASILLVLSAGSYFLLHKTPSQQTAQNQTHDIAPGRNQATLTLASGQKIILSKGLSGKIAQQGNMLIQVNGGNAITYTAATIPNNPTTKIEYNTLTTIRGEQSPYPLVLADGTKVWLNAASSVTFPTAFTGNERKVTITGEAYFEVVHNAAQPFRVIAKGQTIEDIGTSFNVNAYDDEPVIKTTLLEGSVKVLHKSASMILKPGQQAWVRPASANIKVIIADKEEAMAWKNGYFIFNNEQIESVMRKVSRWYNVDIEYTAGQKISENYLGSMTRFSNVSEVLKKLEITGNVKFKLVGKKIIVSNK